MTKYIAALFALVLIAAGAGYVYKTEKLPEAVKSTPRATSVDLRNQGLASAPKNIFSQTNITKLDLSDNNLTGSLPAEIRHLQKLEVLDISNNRMTGLPAELGQLSYLRVLNASNNQLTGLPHELGNLQNLEMLNLSGNNVSQADLEIIRAKLPSTTNIIL